MKKIQSKQSGFTIIEVVLVLAIAGLIFLVVFLALPQLQRSRRDTARRDQVGRIISSLTQSASNAGGDFPQNLAEFESFVEDDNYFGACSTTGNPTECESFSDPSEGSIDISYGYATGLNWGTVGDRGVVFYRDEAVCNGGDSVAATGSRQIAVVMTLEQGGSYCQDNSD